jgi:RND family efflux transporter MFP subunit
MLFRFLPAALAAGFAALTAVMPAGSASAADFKVEATEKIELKAVFGRVEARDIVLARARIGGTIVALSVEEGSAVKPGDVMAKVIDDKLALQIDAVDARLKGLNAELGNAVTELERAKSLLAGGVVAKSKVDAAQTLVDVLTNQVSAAKAERAVLVQQGAEGEVIAPGPGRVLSVPVTRGSVVMPGETIARIAGGGYFLRLSLPERHAAQIHEGGSVLVAARGAEAGAPDAGTARQGKLVKVYPEIDSGRVTADVEVDGLGDYFVGERTRVWIPVDRRQVIGIPPQAISNRYGVDYVRLAASGGEVDVAVIAGEIFDTPAGPRVEILSGLVSGDTVQLP